MAEESENNSHHATQLDAIKLRFCYRFNVRENVHVVHLKPGKETYAISRYDTIQKLRLNLASYHNIYVLLISCPLCAAAPLCRTFHYYDWLQVYSIVSRGFFVCAYG